MIPKSIPSPSQVDVGLVRSNDGSSVRTIQPRYLNERDYPWLRALLDERERFVGRKRCEWEQRLAEGLPVAAPRRKLAVALRVLDRLARDAVAAAVPPRQLRTVVFQEAAVTADRALALARAAQSLGVSEHSAQQGLFADITGERVLRAIEPLSPEQLALRSNVELIAQLLGRALRVRLRASGKVRAVVRHAKQTGLLCRMDSCASKDEVELEISGPFALFHHTRIYARALTSLLPRLAGCQSFRLDADCILGEDETLSRLVLRHSDPIFPAREPPAPDAKVEERFAKDFARLAPAWEVVREPAALEAGESLIYPDFELRHRATGECWLLEIVGYWTPEYLQKKIAALQAASCDSLIVCIDEQRCCGDEPLELDARVVRYRRRLHARDVLARIDPAAYEALPPEKRRTNFAGL